MSQALNSSSLAIPAAKVSTNRKVVVVDQEMVRVEIAEADAVEVTASSEASTSKCDVTQADESLSTSRSSCDSMFLLTSVEDLSVPTLEEKLIDDLGNEIAHASMKHAEFMHDIKEIPGLKEKIEALDKEKKRMKEEAGTKSAIIDSLKERLSVLHEQNSQLSQLVQVSGGQSETLRIRNALVASLAQLKKLQVQIDEIPMLKRQVSSLMEENKNLKEREKQYFPTPDGNEHLSYGQLLQQNMHYRSRIQEMSQNAVQMAEQLKHLSILIENLSQDIGDYKKSHSCETFTSCISKLEGEKEAPLAERREIDMVTLSADYAVLEKNYSSLHGKLQEMGLQFSKHKEMMVDKLFGIRLSELEIMKSEIHQSIAACEDVHDDSLMPRHFVKGDGAVNTITLLPCFQTQVSKLHQLRMVYRHTKSALGSLTSQNKAMDEVLGNHQVEVIKNLKSQVRSLEASLRIGHSNRTSSSDEASLSKLLKDNVSLLVQVDSLSEKLTTLLP